MTFLTHQLSNGIRIVHKPTDSLLAHCGITINAGSRDELIHEQGLAHFIEHIIFKGTTKRKTHHVLGCMENIGGEVNAYTSKEDTCIHSSFMNQYYARFLELLSDIIFNSTFPDKEIEKEKDIVIDEINSYKDSPGEQIIDDFDELLYKDNPLGRNILGTPKNIKSFNKIKIQDFIKANYATDEMVICSVGKIEFKKLIYLVDKYFGHVPYINKKNNRAPINGYTPEIKAIKRRNHQVHCVIGNRAYSADNDLKTAMILLNNILAGPVLNSRLNMVLREKYGLCYTVESNYQPYSDTGVFSIYFGTDKNFLERVIELTTKEMNKLRNEKLGSLQIMRAKQQLKGQVAIALESNFNEMLSLGKSILLYNKVDTIEEINKKVDETTTSNLLEVANQVFDPLQMSMLIYKP
ncbi:MAG: insulinase family protein [Bacteroidetes bacterium]|nr:insulinase family protein [Bacteroidota bacterium]